METVITVHCKHTQKFLIQSTSFKNMGPTSDSVPRRTAQSDVPKISQSEGGGPDVIFTKTRPILVLYRPSTPVRGLPLLGSTI